MKRFCWERAEVRWTRYGRGRWCGSVAVEGSHLLGAGAASTTKWCVRVAGGWTAIDRVTIKQIVEPWLFT